MTAPKNWHAVVTNQSRVVPYLLSLLKYINNTYLIKMRPVLVGSFMCRLLIKQYQLSEEERISILKNLKILHHLNSSGKIIERLN